MSHLAIWIHSTVAQALGWTLVHFVWEGAVLALVLAASLWLLRPASSRWRYALACLVLAAMPVAFAVTLALTLPRQPVPVPVPPGPIPALAMSVPVSAAAPVATFTLAHLLDRLAWLAPFWIAGVAFFYARGMAGWIAVERLRRRGVCAAPPGWQVRLDELAARMRLIRPVALLESCLTGTPVLIGYLRPVVLLPLGCLTGLSAGQVECILLHELAHVRRHDYVVNLLESAVEGLLFYHPAVWWVSSVVRAERENCCDDAVVEMVGDARAYAATLAVLEQRRSLAPQTALAATGGNLMQRIRRLTMEPRRAQTSAAPAVSAGVMLVLFAAALAAWTAKAPAQRRLHATPPVVGVALEVAAANAQVKADPPNKQAEPPAGIPTPYQKWLTEDVAYIITDGERAAFRRLQTDSERETFIENFWLRRDPTPGTVENEFKEEHYRRIAYANEHFSSQIPGWKTDRGRIYITYGPPDEIEDRSNTPSRSFLWHYRHIDGIGNDVVIEFEDPSGNGEYHMTRDPSAKRAVADADHNRVLIWNLRPGQSPRIFASREDPAVSVMVSGRRHSAGQPGTIGVGDILSLGFFTAGVTANAAVENRNLINLEQAIAGKKVDLDVLLRKYNPQFPDVQLAEEQLRTLEERRSAIEMEQATAGPVTLREDTRTRVRPDGTISVPFAGEVMAAGFTPSELDAALAHALSGSPIQQAPRVQILELVTVQVSLDGSVDWFHVFGQVTTPSRRIVQSFEADVPGRPALARIIPLAAGTYRLTVVVKNQVTGLAHNSELDFTVD